MAEPLTSVGTELRTDVGSVSTVAIVGNSPLALFIAKIFDQELARQAHQQVLYFSSDLDQTISQHYRSLLGQAKLLKRTDLFEHTRVVPELPKSVNLNHQRMVTSRGNVPYQVLILDQTPTYTVSQIRSIAKQARELMLRLKAASNIGKKQLAAIHFRGNGYWSWQLALALRSDLREIGGSLEQRLAVKVDCQPSQTKLGDFFRDNGLMAKSAETILPGFTVSEPKKPLEVAKLRGASLDQRGQVISRDGITAEGNPNVFIIDRSIRQRQNMLQNDYDLAKQICRKVRNYLDTGQITTEVAFDEAMILSGFRDDFAWVGLRQVAGLRAKAILKLDELSSRRLLG